EDTIVERMRAESQKPPKATSQKPRAKSQEPRVESGPRQFVGRAFWFDSSRESGATVSMLIAASKISSSRQTEQRYSTPSTGWIAASLCSICVEHAGHFQRTRS